MNDRNLQHPDITRLERDGELTQRKTGEIFCENCDTEITEEQSAFNLCAQCEKDAWERFRDLLLSEFTTSELEFISACVEGNTLEDIETIIPLPAIY